MTLDLLLARGEVIDQVLVIYLASNPRYDEAFQRLLGEFAGDRYRGRACRLRGIPIRLGEAEEIDEARSPAEVDAVWQAFHQNLAALKAEHGQVHLSLTGGRRILSLLAMSAAMLDFTTADRAWHIFTPRKTQGWIEDNQLLHAPPDSGTRLIEVPLTPWATLFPGLRDILSRSPNQMRGERTGWRLSEEERSRCQQVWGDLSAHQREALRKICTTSNRAEAAQALGVSVSTLDDHKTAIFRACRLAWEMERNVDLAFLRKYFAPFLAEQETR